MHRCLAAGALVDGILLPLGGFWSSLQLLQSEGRHAEHAFHMTFDEMEPHFAVQIVVYALSIGGLLGLLRGRNVPDGLAPARGIWARRLVALLSLFGLLFVVTGDMWPSLLFGAGPERALTLLFLLGVGLYLTPSWYHLACGWGAKNPLRMQPASRRVTP